MSSAALAGHPVLATPLEGTSLIEASAGTGKTWTIVGLTLRLLIERAVPLRSILVVTFTNAATAELKERIRRELHALREALANPVAPRSPAHPLIDALIGRIDPIDRPAALARIVLAVESLDEAAIHTIHGFCQRLLAEHAFASGSPFETEVRTSQTRLVNEVARDFWRRTIGNASAFEARLLAAKGRDPSGLVAAARLSMGARIAEVLQPDAVDVAMLGDRLAVAYRDASQAWAGARNRIEIMLLAGVLSRTKYPPKSVPGWCDEVDEYLGHELAPLDGPVRLDRFGTAFMANAVNKGKTPPTHAFFAAADQLVNVLTEINHASDAHWYRLVARFAIEGAVEIAKRKKAEGWQSYDDMLMRVHEALSSEQGVEFARAVAKRYTVALIDEFQDTDDVQYAILRQLFQETACAMVLVGDPKQAIYGFRGADVFAYLRARGGASGRFDLNVNRRSTGPLLAAINALCGRGPGRFLLKEIEFKPAESPLDDGPALVSDDDLPPFVLWFVPGAPGDPAPKGASRVRIAQAVAAEIARLLDASKSQQIDDGGSRRLVNGQDIAILVSRHAEADLMRDALGELNIASVTFGDRSIFQAREADDVAQLLSALAMRDDERLIRGALATPLFGMTLTDLVALANAPLEWEAVLQRFHQYRVMVDAGDLVRVFREIVATTDLAGRMLGAPGGDRAISNYQQLAELVHDAQRNENLDAAGALRFLQRAMSADEPADDEQQLRLETDEALVRIMTIHRAKGLEFPIVFCPFLWDGQVRAGNMVPIRFHDSHQRNAAVIDFGSPNVDAHRAVADTEALAERIRVAYVALTRAKLRCYVVWGAMKECASSALAWLIHGPEEPDTDLAAARQALVNRLQALSPAAFHAEVEAVAATAGRGMAVIELPDPAVAEGMRVPFEPPLGHAREFAGSTPLPRRISSYSGLVANVDLDVPDHDGLIATDRVDEREPEDDIVAFPRGANAGSCLHAVFERVLRERVIDAKSWPAIATRALDEFGLPTRLEATVVRIIEHVLTTPLDAGSNLLLGAIPADARLIETEFWYPIRGDGLATLESVVGLHRTARGLPPLAHGSIRRGLAKGYMKGFIDLVFEQGGRFFIADYKSNWLGATIDQYGAAALAVNIANECYDLQYLLYTLAVDRYLAARIADYDYQTHFGGVFYLYLRGLRRHRGVRSGVYFSRPMLPVIEALRSLGPTGTA